MDASGSEEGCLIVPFTRRLAGAGAEAGGDQVRAAELALIAAAQAGDRGAFGSLYDRYARMVHGILLARVPRADVEDLVQEVFLHAMQRLAGLREARAFGGWLAAMARNMAIDHLRRALRTGEMPDDLAAPSLAAPVGGGALEVLRVIRALPAAYRETLVLRLVEGMTGPEIAERTGLTPASVRVNLHRGMKQLRARLERSGVRG